MTEPPSFDGKKFLFTAVAETRRVFWHLFVLSFPLLVLIKLLDDHFGIVGAVGDALAPLMSAVGLPGETALVFATGLFINIYAAGLVLINLWSVLDLTAAQITVLLTMVLIAHALPVECRIAQKAGMRFVPAAVLRLAGAVALGALLNAIYADRFLQHRPAAPLPATAAADGWGGWLLTQAQHWAAVLGIIFALVVFINTLKATHIEQALINRLTPFFALLGIRQKTAAMALVGLLLGLSYGGGLLIERARKGDIDRRELLCVLATLSLCHAVIEDALLVMLLGAHWTGVVAARLLFSFALMFFFAHYIYRADEKTIDRLSPYPRSASHHTKNQQI